MTNTERLEIEKKVSATLADLFNMHGTYIRLNDPEHAKIMNEFVVALIDWVETRHDERAAIRSRLLLEAMEHRYDAVWPKP